ncbi:hypothetical protein JTB14_010655 [Gonioctena quinquepunctata]|nr:hypothetical protein JTB14_010655 [Gonioctena quinquepunctata]
MDTKNKPIANGDGDAESPLNKSKANSGGMTIMKKEKRQSRFNITKNQELEMLPPLRAACTHSEVSALFFVRKRNRVETVKRNT